MTTQNLAHAFAPDQGLNVRCTCGAEYSLVANLRRHIDLANARDAVAALGIAKGDIVKVGNGEHYWRVFSITDDGSAILLSVLRNIDGSFTSRYIPGRVGRMTVSATRLRKVA